MSAVPSTFRVQSVVKRATGVDRRFGRNFSSSPWNTLEAAPADPILGLNEAFKKDVNPNKVLLGMGVYRDDNSKPYILPCVREAEERILAADMDHEYAGIEGIPSFIAKA